MGAPPYEYAASILAEPPDERGTQRSRGMDSMVTCLVVGLTRTRIIDCVRTASAWNLESSSEPSSRTVNAGLPASAAGAGAAGAAGAETPAAARVAVAVCAS